MYRIKTDNLTLRLEMARVDTLKPHEAVLPQKVSCLSAEFGRRTNLNNPIIVDQHRIVLDGNHRVQVFRLLGFRYIPVCRINYFNDAAKLRYWYRLMHNVVDMAPIRRAVSRHGGRMQAVTSRAALQQRLAAQPPCCGLQHRGRFWVVTVSAAASDVMAAYQWIHEFQSMLEGDGISVDYIPCRHARAPEVGCGIGATAAVLWTPAMTKQIVVAAACGNQVFPPKTTRHLIPARPLNVDVSSRWFDDVATEVEINRRFDRFLREKRLQRFGPGQVIDGRYYEEEVFVFRDPRPR